MFARTGFLIVCILGMFLSSCSETYFPEPDSEGGWRKNSEPEFIRDLGLDTGGLDDFGAYNFKVGFFSSVIVIKDGWVIKEWYAHPREKPSRAYVASIGKTFALACFGIAVKDAAEGSLEEQIARTEKLYDKRWLIKGFPLSDPQKKDITFEQVFRHTAGFVPEDLADRDYWNDYYSWVVGHDPKSPQTQNLFYSPGYPQEYSRYERWGDHQGVYSSIGFAHIGLVLEQLYGVPAHDFLWNRLLKPIGFSGIDYYRPPAPPLIKWFTGGGLQMTAMDLARFAYFMMHNGRWKGEQLLPGDWVQSLVSKPYYQNLRSNIDGYFGRQYPADMFRMYGSGGNFVFVIPSLDLIVVRTGRIPNFFMERLERDFLRRLFNMIPAYRTS